MTSDYKVLGQSNPTAANLTDCYTVPASIQAVVSSVLIANRSATPTTFRISVAPAGAGDSLEQYIAYDADISGNDVVDFTIGMTLDTTDVVRVYATDATLSFNVYGEEIGGSGGGGGFAVGSSYLLATNPGDDNVPNSSVVLPWTLASSLGSDIAIDGGDSTHINFLTTGVYCWAFRADVYPEATTLQNVAKEVHLNSSVAGLIQDDSWQFDSGIVGDWENIVVMPAYLMTAGDFLCFAVNCFGADNSFGYANIELSVFRLG